MSLNILKIDSSGRHEGSHSRRLTRNMVEALRAHHPGATIVERDVSEGIEFVDQAWISANFTPKDDRGAAQRARLAGSDALVEELEAADVLVIAVPIYNFGIPAALKAWIDQVCRANRTFRYTPDGPVGLLEGKKAYVAIVSGGTGAGSDVDFATGHIRQVLRFIGIEDITMVHADRLMVEGEEKVDRAFGAFETQLAA